MSRRIIEAVAIGLVAAVVFLSTFFWWFGSHMPTFARFGE